MRIPVILLAAALVAPAVHAQDLQLNMKMTMTTPEAVTDMPGTNVAMYLKGSKLRIDSFLDGELRMSMIYDSVVGKTWMLLHDNRIYMESPNSPFAREGMPDSAQLAAMGIVPDVRSTGEKQVIAGHEAERFSSVMRLPKGAGPETRPMAIVSETWLATDPELNRVYYSYADRMQAFSGMSGDRMQNWGEAFQQRVPVRTTMVMLTSEPGQNLDAEAILRANQPPGLQARTVVELENMKTATLPDSLFKIPAGYTQGALR